jgi:hypothetical protein
LQNRCKSPYFLIGAFLKVSGDLLGLLHGCCTTAKAYKLAKTPIRYGAQPCRNLG